MKRNKTAESLKEILPKILRDLEEKGSLEKLEKIWGLTVGSRASKHSKIANFKKEILIVNVDSSMWIYELTLKKNKILQEIKKEEPFKDTKDIRFRIAEF